MPESLQEFVDSRGLAIRVDRDAGVIRGVKILGLASRNNRSYPAQTLAQAAPLYEGAKVNVNHPKGPAAGRDYQDRIGLLRNVTLRSDEGLFADFHFNPRHTLAEQLLWDAEHAPENVGFSHNVEARTATRDGRVIVEAILKVQSVDLVADPATTRGLFEAQTAPGGMPTWADVTAEALQAARPDLLEALLAPQRAAVTRLEEEVAQLRAAAARQQRDALLRRLLREYRLGEPDADDPRQQAIVSPAFLEQLRAAGDEPALRALVEERARLVHSLQGGTPATRPLARDQALACGTEAGDARRFVEAVLTGG